MTETEFLRLADSTLIGIEAALERAAVDTGLDVECSRSGNVLEIEFVDRGSKIIVNGQQQCRKYGLLRSRVDFISSLTAINGKIPATAKSCFQRYRVW